MTKNTGVTSQPVRMPGRAEDGLGPNSDIGSRLRALYGAVQDEGIPEQLLDLLERLDSAEAAHKDASSSQDGE
jgi:hypothetical protein